MTTEKNAQTIQELERFYKDLLRLKQMLRERGSASPSEAQAREELRQDLLRRSGRIRVALERVWGGAIYIQAPYGIPRQDSLWDLALTSDHPYNQRHYAQALADRIYQAIGSVEADPSRLDPPPPPQVPRTGGQTQHNYIFAPSNVAQSVSGNASQNVTVGATATQVHDMLDELLKAAKAAQADAEDVETLQDAIIDLKAEVARPAPRPSRLRSMWAAVSVAATTNDAIGMVDRVQDLLPALATTIGHYIEQLQQLPKP